MTNVSSISETYFSPCVRKDTIRFRQRRDWNDKHLPEWGTQRAWRLARVVAAVKVAVFNIWEGLASCITQCNVLFCPAQSSVLPYASRRNQLLCSSRRKIAPLCVCSVKVHCYQLLSFSLRNLRYSILCHIVWTVILCYTVLLQYVLHYVKYFVLHCVVNRETYKELKYEFIFC